MQVVVVIALTGAEPSIGIIACLMLAMCGIYASQLVATALAGYT